MHLVSYRVDELRAFAQSAAEAVGVPSSDAGVLADSLVDADLSGHRSHGMFRLLRYIDRIQTGAMSAVTKTEVVRDNVAIVVLDGHDGIGQVIALEAMNLAVGRARQHGVGVVAARYSNHIGTLQFYTRQAARQKCIAFITTNASPAIAPWGSNTGILGNNPWSIAAPAGRFDHVVLDIANSVVAYGKIFIANQLGRKIPDAWAVDPEGRPTTDPAAAIAGLLRPMADHKGYAAAFMMEVLAGVLTGAEFATRLYENGRSGLGQLALALDIDAFMPVEEFESRMEALIETVKAAPPMEGFDQVFYPGEPEQVSLKESAGVVPISEDAVNKLTDLGRQLGVQFPDEAGSS